MRKPGLPLMLSGLLAGGLVEAAPPGEVISFVKGLEGKSLWLRVDVIRVQYVLRGEDATKRSTT